MTDHKTPCNACSSRARKGLEGQCYSCANERTRHSRADAFSSAIADASIERDRLIEQLATANAEIERLREQTCDRHAGQKHGAEAEELRSAVEKLLRDGDDDYRSEAFAELREFRQELQRILDETDARDSLAYLESRNEKLAALTKERDIANEHLCSVLGDDLVPKADLAAMTAARDEACERWAIWAGEALRRGVIERDDYRLEEERMFEARKVGANGG